MAKQEAKAEAKPRHLMALNRNHIRPINSGRRVWDCDPPAGTEAKDLCQPEYWKHLAAEMGLRSNDIVYATCQDGAWFAMYLILHVGPQHAKLRVLMEHELEEVSDLASKTTTHEVKWKGPAHRYVVSRLSDGVTVEHGFENEALAATWMHQNMANLAA